jgi:PAS domain S-box-containing protein
MEEPIFLINETSYSVLGRVNGNLASSILELINAYICIIDVHLLKLIWVNKFLMKRLGYSFEELITMKNDEILMLIHPDFRESLIKSVNKLKTDSPKGHNTIYKILAKDGKWLWIIANHDLFESITEDGNKYLIAYGIDIEPVSLQGQFHKLQSLHSELQQLDMKTILSCRQLMVLKQIAKGKTDKEIAEILNISIHTAKTHRKTIIHKLGFKNTGTLINFAVENGLG